MKSCLLSLVILALAQSSFATYCPKKIQVTVSDFKTLSANNESKIDSFFKLGDEQTEKSYIKAVLEVANGLTDSEEVLTYSKKGAPNSSSTCVYRSKTMSLRVSQNLSENGYTAVLTLGKINYQSKTGGNPISHKGNALELITHLISFDETEIIQPKNRNSQLSFNLEIQIPLGDYGTDGFSETAHVGTAKATYSLAD